MRELLTIAEAAKRIINGDVIACPTEAVWGLSCDPFNQKAVEKLLQLKRRPVEKGLIVIFSSVEALQPYVKQPELVNEKMVNKANMRATTWLVETKPESFPLWVTGSHSKLAVRISAHPLLQTLSAQCGPIVSTSANPAAASEAKSLSEVKAYFGDSLYYCQGELGKADKPSIIKDLTTGQVLRG